MQLLFKHQLTTLQVISR